MRIEQLGLQISSPLVHPGAKNFRPPSWPPPPNWSPILNAEGVSQCSFSDPIWPLDIWAGRPLKLNFGDGKIRGASTTKSNADLLRQCAAWFLYGPRGCRTAGSLYGKVIAIKPIFSACSEAGILATDLTSFPKVLTKIAGELSPSNYSLAISILHELLDARTNLGFCVLDGDGLARLAALAPKHHKEQTPYIPPRIWSYQISRIRECLIDYSKNRDKIQACFNFCLGAYANNFGSLKLAINGRSNPSRTPFQSRRCAQHKGCVYHGPFKLTADHFGVTPLIEKWVGSFVESKKQISMLSMYLDLVSMAGLAYLLNFSLMRIDEGWNLRSDCLILENDEKIGDVFLLRGETTKTDPDSDARWPVSESASLAVETMSHIACLRMQCASERDELGPTPIDKENPYLISYQYEPWSVGKHRSYRLRPEKINFLEMVKRYPQMFDAAALIITEEDLRIARLITPTLNPDEFKVGEAWRFGWHQFRRTGTVNMLSSGMVDEPSLQLLLKHQSRVMTLYYGRNFSRLNLSQETRTQFLQTMYEEFGREIRNLQSPQYISPLGSERKTAIVKFIKDSDALQLDKAGRQGRIGARRIRAGFCVKNRSCPYGGHEAIAHCLGGDDGQGCPDLLVDITKEPDIKAYELVIDNQLKIVHPDSPRHNRLQSEKQAIRKFFEILSPQDR